MNASAFPLDQLNPEQQNAVTATEGPVLVLAGAGSGKTRVLTYRIAYLIRQCCIPPWTILAVTFTRKAAREMQERVHELVGPDQGTWIGTFHSTFAKILRWEAPAVHYPTDFVIYDTDDQNRLVRMVMESLQIPVSRFNPKAVQAAISHAKNSLISPEHIFKSPANPFEEAVKRIYPEYQKRLRENYAFDFDDLITVPIQLFNHNTDILEKYQNRFQYILVDEYQDTNKAQYELLAQLAGKNRNLCVVGDDDQSIYGWRGADISNILDFESDFPETRVFRLEQNYRSTKNILTAAHSVVSRNQGRKPKKLWSENPEGDKVELWEVDDDREEAYKLVDKIQEEVFEHKRQFRDFAVLYRTNAQSRSLEDGLRRSGINYIIVGGVRFYDRKEVKDILAYLKLIVNQRDTVSLKRVINFPVRGIGDITLNKIEAMAVQQNIPLFDALALVEQIEGLTSRARAGCLHFYRLIMKYSEIKEKISPGELVHTLVEESGLLAYYKDDTSVEGLSRVENIGELLAAVQDYGEETEAPTLSGFLEEVALIHDVDQWNDQGNAVTLMTLHSAKGLEFPVIFITGLEESLFPLARSLETREDLEEERRLFYVGLTRAREKLVLMWARNRRLYQSSEARLPSRFIGELDPDVLQMQSTRSFRSVPSNCHGASRMDSAMDVMPDYESFSQEPESETYSVGQWVHHEMFGEGQILKIQGTGAKQTLSVRFKNGTQKKLITKYAKFKPIY
ncbi:UvrD-helicase domain-containing protein [bacterium]|nr:UvrD-helicase domain-containing protein [bacterium]